MPNSLLTGVSGLISHQRLLDVVGNNIANVNTHGYKAQRILFADALYESISPASGGADGGQGGTNPAQIGGGVKVSQTDRQFTQGPIEFTGQQLDYALSGDGFFTVSDGESTSYTRSGAFSLDGEGYLVNPEGLYVRRFGVVGEPTAVEPGFQVPGDNRIQVPIGAAIQGIKSTEIDITGNLSGLKEPPRAQELRAATAYRTQDGSIADGSTLLNDLETIVNPFQSGDVIQFEGRTHAGELFDVAFDVDQTTTLQELVDAINAEMPQATAVLEDGRLVVTAAETGESELSLAVRSGDNQTGSINFASYKAQTTPGKSADTVETLARFYDEAGGDHEVKVIFGKQDDDTWSLDVKLLDSSSGEVVSDPIDPIVFDDAGNRVSTGDPSVTLQIDGIASPQTLTFNFGNPSSATRLTHFESDSSLVPNADGAPPGVLTTVQVDADGSVKGVASNGKTFSIAQLSIAKFRNNKGLIARAENLYAESLNSGQPEIGQAGTGGRGIVKGGQLESSNVDIALEFTKLIVAQRGFSANARTITVASEVLEELTNIIR